jgi:hypothetical protein
MFALGTYPLPATIERFGRRRILFWSAFVCAILMTIFVILIGMPSPTVGRQWGAAVIICTWNMVFGYGWIGVPWLYGPEVRSVALPAPIINLSPYSTSLTSSHTFNPS